MTLLYMLAVAALIVLLGWGLWRRTRITSILLAVCVLIGVSLLLWARPMFELPKPTGEFAVGTTQLHLVDRSRPEPHTANPLDHRELMVRVWYPADVSPGGKIAPYWPDAASVRRAMNEDSWPLGWAISHFGKIPTHSAWDAPVAARQSQYPVLIFSHGLSMGRATQNTVLMEELASRGYIVFSIDHPYGGLATAYPDGRVVRFSNDAWNVNYEQAPAEVERRYRELRNGKDTDALRRALESKAHAQPTEMQLRRYWYDVWSRDQRFVLDEIQRLQSAATEQPLAGHLQLERIGVFGMSFGGVAAGLTCATDARCKAGINLDGFGEVALEYRPHKMPFLYFNNGSLRVNATLMEHDAGYRYFAQVAGSEHLDFSDAPLWSPLLKRIPNGESASGTIEPARMLSLLNAYVTAFFDTHLRDQPSDLLQESATDFPEVSLIAREPLHQELDAAQIGPVASGFAAKLACSGVFVSGRALQDVIRNDIERMSPLAAGVKYSLDRSQRTVTATHAGTVSEALYRPGLGCTLLNGTDRQTLLSQAPSFAEPAIVARAGLWPAGDDVELTKSVQGLDRPALDLAVAHAFEDTPEREIDTRAMVVVHDGRIVAERYAAGFTSASRMLGWSASKSVLAAIVGTMVADGKLSLDQRAPVPEWQGADDERGAITLDQLLRMSSGLSWNEDYVPGSDSTRMLFGVADMGGYAAAKPLRHDPGVRWEYSSGTTNLLSRIALQTLGSPLEYQQYIRRRLLEPAGMSSFVLERDATGAFIGSSYAYATARDWARFGLLHLNRGEIDGRRILPADWVDYIHEPLTALRSRGGAHFWLNVQRNPVSGERLYPSLPDDFYFASGNRTQLVTIFPSRQAVIVRLGWTMDGAEFDFDKHFAAILRALPPP